MFDFMVFQLAGIHEHFSTCFACHVLHVFMNRLERKRLMRFPQCCLRICTACEPIIKNVDKMVWVSPVRAAEASSASQTLHHRLHRCYLWLCCASPCALSAHWGKQIPYHRYHTRTAAAPCVSPCVSSHDLPDR